MAGYAVSSQIDHVTPRVASRARASATPEPVPDVAADVTTIDLVGRPLDEILAERWDELREILGPMTFYLFDPESWR